METDVRCKPLILFVAASLKAFAAHRYYNRSAAIHALAALRRLSDDHSRFKLEIIPLSKNSHVEIGPSAKNETTTQKQDFDPDHSREKGIDNELASENIDLELSS
jgi:hypothetical protein